LNYKVSFGGYKSSWFPFSITQKLKFYMIVRWASTLTHFSYLATPQPFTGMMTGQILGGTSVMQAARYQILIVYFIATCSFGTILMELQLALRLCFDSKSKLRTDFLQKRGKKIDFLAVIISSFKGFFQFFILSKNASRQRSSSLTLNTDESMYLAPNGALSVMTTSHDEKKKMERVIISVEEISYRFKIQENEENGKLGKGHDTKSTIRILFENLSFKIYAGDMALIMGPSGAGKSTLLRAIAGLTDADAEKIKLNGNTQESCTFMPFWRRMVRYVPQTKVDIPGTPNDFIIKITSFKTWKRPSCSDVKYETRELARKWGMNVNLLNSEWKVLSGGESQRMLVAISLASLCKGGVILLDESTSALDLETKIKVEKSVKEYCAKLSAVAIWISHDPGQKDRMKLR
jgi:ABC-type iron transport system FetAB ATPase subunit